MTTKQEAPILGLDRALYANTAWKLDPTHTNVQFSVRHMMSRVTGTFKDPAGVLHQGAADLTGSTMEITIDAATINTNTPDRDTHLRSADFFDVATYPQIIFTGTEFIRTGEETFDVKGRLTMHGVTRDVVLNATDSGRAKDPWGNVRAGFQATTTVNRSDFDLKWNAALETGGVLVGEKVTLTLDTEFVWQGPGTGN